MVFIYSVVRFRLSDPVLFKGIVQSVFNNPVETIDTGLEILLTLQKYREPMLISPLCLLEQLSEPFVNLRGKSFNFGNPKRQILDKYSEQSTNFFDLFSATSRSFTLQSMTSHFPVIFLSRYNLLDFNFD